METNKPTFAYNRLIRLLSELTPVIDEFMLEAPQMRVETLANVHRLSERALESIVKIEEYHEHRER